MALVSGVSPVAIQQFFNNIGQPLAGGKLAFYLAGTSTPTPAYSDIGLTTPLANPVTLDAAGRAPELFLAPNSYKQVLSDANNVQLWSADNLLVNPATRSQDVTIALTGTQNNVPLPGGQITFLECQNSGAPLTITGFQQGNNGDMLIVRAYGMQVDLLHSNAGSAYGNQLYNWSNSGPTSLSANRGIAMYVYRYPFWILINHEQGSWLTVPYAAGNYVSQAADQTTPMGTWTVPAASVQAHAYYLKGTNLTVTFSLFNTTVAGSPIFLRVGGFPYTPASQIYALPFTSIDASVGYTTQAIGWASGTNSLVLARSSQAAWANGACSVFGQMNMNVN